MATEINTLEHVVQTSEAEQISNILFPNEHLVHGVKCVCNKRFGVLFASNMRAIFVHKGMFSNSMTESFPFEKISSVQYETKWSFGTLSIFSLGNKAVFDQMNQERGKVIADFIHSKQFTSKDTEPTITKGDDVFVKLEKLGKLKEQGIVTEEEFQEKKRQLLSQI